jgi:hypothetical protein
MKKNSIIEKRFTSPHPFDLFMPDFKGPHPLICMTPILGRLLILEDLFFERRFARFFAKRGFAVALIHRPIFEYRLGKGLSQIQIYLEQSLKRNKEVLDSIIQFPDVDTTRIGSFGVSFGSILNCLWASADCRLKTNVFVLGGGNIPEIFITSRDPLMRSYFKAALKDTKLETNELLYSLKESLKLDPLTSCQVLEPNRTLMVIAKYDRVVRKRFSLDLWNALRRPKTIFLPLGHYGSLLAIPFIRGRILRFFKNKLRAEANINEDKVL